MKVKIGDIAAFPIPVDNMNNIEINKGDIVIALIDGILVTGLIIDIRNDFTILMKHNILLKYLYPKRVRHDITACNKDEVVKILTSNLGKSVYKRIQ